VKLKIWDTAGQERFRNITTQYYKNADGILLVYDVSEITTFEKISQWINQIKTNNTNENVVVLLVGNKCDVDKREVSEEQARSLAKEYGMTYFETSAMTNYNIEAAFSHLADEIIKVKNYHQNKFRSETFEKQAVKLEEYKKQDVKSKEKKCC
jgi:small GTP-binding protein